MNGKTAGTSKVRIWERKGFIHRGKTWNYVPLCVPRAWAQRLCLISYATIYVPIYVCHVSHTDVIHPERSRRRRRERTEEKKKKKSKEKGKKSHCKINSGKNLYYVKRCMWWMFIRERYVQYIYLCVSNNIIFFLYIYISIMRRVFKVWAKWGKGSKKGGEREGVWNEY